MLRAAAAASAADVWTEAGHMRVAWCAATAAESSSSGVMLPETCECDTNEVGPAARTYMTKCQQAVRFLVLQ